jgi:ribosomal protein L32E
LQTAHRFDRHFCWKWRRLSSQIRTFSGHNSASIFDPLGAENQGEKGFRSDCNILSVHPDCLSPERTF